MKKCFEVFEEVSKEVVPFGNGSIVYTPKKWIGQTVKVILEKEPLDVKSAVLEQLKPFSEHVEAAFLHGSFARGEQTQDSDIDVLVVADKKLAMKKKGRFDFTVVDRETLSKGLSGKDLLFAYSVLREAKPILNSSLLEELRKTKIDECNFSWFLEESCSALKISEELLGIDKAQGREILDSTAIIYSIVLRLRGLFLLQCFSSGKEFSNKGFKVFLSEKGFSRSIVESFLGVYRSERDDKKPLQKVSVENAEKLLLLAKKEVAEAERRLEKCLQKRS